jgi:RNA polymerase-binding transcription factor DksA
VTQQSGLEELNRRRLETLAQVADLRSELEAIVVLSMTETPDDEHDSEGSTIGFERARVSALLAHAEHQLADLDAAIVRLQGGTYGRCEQCGQPIGADRLEALPTAATCVTCASRRATGPIGRR